MDGNSFELHRYWKAIAYPGKLWSVDGTSRPLSSIEGLISADMQKVYPSLGRCMLAMMLTFFSVRARWYYPAEPRASASSAMTVFVYRLPTEESGKLELGARMHIAYRASAGHASASIFTADEQYYYIELGNCEAQDGLWDVVGRVLREMFNSPRGKRGSAAQTV